MKTKFIGIVLAMVVGAGCARVPRPVLAPERIAGTAKEQILAAFKTNDAALQSFKGLARGVLDDGGDRAVVRYVMLFKRPDNLRIEALPSTGAYTLSVLAANPSGVVMIDPVNKRGYRSADAAHALKTALRIPIPPRDLTSYLLGMLPGAMVSDALDLRSSPNGIQVVAGDFASYWLVDPSSQRLKRVELRRVPHGRPVLTIEYAGYIRSGEWLYPEQLRIEVPGESLVATITFRSTDFNPMIRDESFWLSIPAEYSVYEGPESPGH